MSGANVGLKRLSRVCPKQLVVCNTRTQVETYQHSLPFLRRLARAARSPRSAPQRPGLLWFIRFGFHPKDNPDHFLVKGRSGGSLFDLRKTDFCAPHQRSGRRGHQYRPLAISPHKHQKQLLRPRGQSTLRPSRRSTGPGFPLSSSPSRSFFSPFAHCTSCARHQAEPPRPGRADALSENG